MGLFATMVAAAAPSLLKNINTQVVQRSSYPVFIGVSGSRALFVATASSGSGTSLWRTDGTAGGTAEIPGVRPSGGQFPDRIQGRDRAIFVGQDAGGTGRVMSSDGSTDGTVTLPIAGNAMLLNAVGTLADGTAVFAVRTYETGFSLWASDGTAGNTRELGGVFPQHEASDTVQAGARLFFVGSSIAHGEELWATDGTAAGTHVVLDVDAGPEGSAPRIVGSTPRYVYFTAGSATPGRLWRISKATGVAELYIGLTPAGGGAFYQPGVVEIPGGAVFCGNTELVFRNDVTGEASRVMDFTPGATNDQVTILGQVGQRALFSARTDAAGVELWVTDGTAAGTQLVRDIRPGADSSSPQFVGQLDNEVIFSAWDAALGQSVLWKSDGTSAGTMAMVDQPTADPGADPLVVAWPRLNARSLWRVNRASGVAREYRPDFQIAEFNPELRIGSTWFFAGGSSTQGSEPALSDVAGVRFIVDLQVQVEDAPSAPMGFASAGGQTYFVASPRDGEAGLWKTDGTAAGTVPVYAPGSDASRARGTALVSVGNRLYYMGNDGEHGSEPWVSDGTEAGTRMLRDIAPGTEGSVFMDTQRPFCQKRWIAQLGSHAYFGATDGVLGIELWRTDGTESGTQLFMELVPGPQSAAICGLHAWNGLLFFQVDLPSGASALYRSDGTTSGTYPILTLGLQAAGGLSHDFVVFEGRLMFSTLHGGTGRRIWSTDGTVTGTTPLSFSGTPAFVPRILTGVVNGRLIIHGNRGTEKGIYAFPSLTGAPTLLAETCGAEYLGVTTGGVLFASGVSGMCVTDGTPAGTRNLENLFNSEGSLPGALHARNGVVYFIAQLNGGQPQLVKSDGTVAGTLAGPALINSYLGMAMSPQGPIFAASAPDTGMEPWIWSSPAPAAANDSATMSSGSSLDIVVLANDTDSDGTLLPRLVRIVESPTTGTAMVTETGAIRYSAPAGYTGAVSLRYSVTDSFGSESAPARVDITVGAAPSSGGGGGSGASGGGGSIDLGVLALLLVSSLRCGFMRSARRGQP